MLCGCTCVNRQETIYICASDCHSGCQLGLHSSQRFAHPPSRCVCYLLDSFKCICSSKLLRVKCSNSLLRQTIQLYLKSESKWFNVSSSQVRKAKLDRLITPLLSRPHYLVGKGEVTCQRPESGSSRRPFCTTPTVERINHSVIKPFPGQ